MFLILYCLLVSQMLVLTLAPKITPLAGYPARPYAELIRSDIPGSRSSPAATLGSSPTGLTAATPTRGEILVHLGALSRKPRSVKRKKPSSTEEDRPVAAKFRNWERLRLLESRSGRRRL